MALTRRIQKKLRRMGNQRRSQEEVWERRWAERQTPMRWETEITPQVLIDALDDGFIAPGASIMDIGCGTGDIAAFLASRGHETVGSDFSTAAVARANELHSHASLSFKALDAAQVWPNPRTFDALFDRGCLHCLSVKEVAVYAQNAAASLREEGSFLLLHKHLLTKQEQESTGTLPAAHVEQRVRKAFSATFDISRVEDIDMMDGVIRSTDQEIPAVAFWMTRKGS